VTTALVNGGRAFRQLGSFLVLSNLSMFKSKAPPVFYMPETISEGGALQMNPCANYLECAAP